ncbi:hypothetical protein QO010_004444 [Caulobacter ginsengisoli]|uniref:DUF4908 domain-containing protein n=1 Tax=Caulobacter ginsengisoli TaxID=400775 RepID=A0ABU0IZQ3_9CAUL|nr:DUF4908 domain-containing protein [Caulobacter ginsengisoli]MDQ0466648.1 hypothetical protein [Caulobacter ginsengisoli]
MRLPAVALLILAAMTGSPAIAQTKTSPRQKAAEAISPLRDFLFPDKPDTTRRASAPPIARYVSESGIGFTFDRAAPRPLLRFEDSSEIWVLRAEAGPRGDTLYKNDTGRVVLRDTKVGGLILFTPQHREGEAAAMTGAAGAIKLPLLGPKQLFQRLAVASSKVSTALHRQIAFEADVETPLGTAMVGDAVMVVATSLIRMAERPGGPQALARITKVYITEGPKPVSEIRNGVLVIIVAPGMGLASRPSSERVAYVASSR